jgi:hypothetical protein
MCAETFHRTESDDALRQFQRLQSRNYWRRTCISLWIPCTRSLNISQIAQTLRSSENGTFRWSAIQATLTEWSRWRRSRYASGIFFYFRQETLYPLQTYNGYVLAYNAQRFTFERVQLTLSSTDSQGQSRSRTGYAFFGTARSSDGPGTKQFWSHYNRQQVIILFRISPCRNLISIARWDARKNQIKNWHRRVSDFDHLVCQRNPQSAACTQMYCT